MGLIAVTETAELFRQKNISMTERDKEFVVQFAFRTNDRELTNKLIDELMDEGADRNAVCRKYQAETKDDAKMVIASTASPFKFTRSVMDAVRPGNDAKSDFELADELSRLSGVPVPQAVEEIRTAPVLHREECEAGDMPLVVRRFLGIN